MNIKAEIKDLQQRIAILESQLLDEPSYDWDTAPVICQLNGFEYRLGPEADERMTWNDAARWCESMGGELPSREILLLCYLNDDTRKEFKTTYYWATNEYAATYASVQNFYSGSSQGNANKECLERVRAVKRFPLDN